MKLDAERVKEHADIVQVVGQYVKLQPAGPGELVGMCPFHKERTGSFTVTPSKQAWYCFGCAVGGDVFEFMKRIEGLSAFGDVVKRVAEVSGADVAAMEAPVDPNSHPPSSKPTQGRIVATYPYTDEHGEELYEVLRIEPGRNGKTKDFRQRRIHPIDGAVVWGITAGAYRKGANGEWYPLKGQPDENDDELPEVPRVLYRLPAVLQAETVYLVEGEKDVHTLESAGLVATTNSGGAGQKWMPEWTAALAGRRVIVIPDNDEPGKKRATVIQRALTGQASEVVTIEVPKGKDVTDWFTSGGTRDQLEEMVLETRRRQAGDELERRGLLSPAEIVEWFDGGINAFLDPSKRARGLTTGFYRLDEMTLGLHGGELVILAARPAQGKTAMAMNIADHVSATGHTVAVFSLEMAREQLLTRMLCSRARVNQLDFRAGRLDRDERNRIQRAFSEVCEMPLFIDDNPSIGLKSMHKKLTTLLERGSKLGLVVVDYLQLMGSTEKENRTQEVSALSRGLKIMAREFKVPFLVLSQLSRAVETRQGNHRPQLSDLRESGGIEQDADVVAFIFREETYKPDAPELRGLAELIVAKQRNGPTGTVRLTFLHPYTKFENRAESFATEDTA